MDIGEQQRLRKCAPLIASSVDFCRKGRSFFVSTMRKCPLSLVSPGSTLSGVGSIVFLFLRSKFFEIDFYYNPLAQKDKGGGNRLLFFNVETNLLSIP